VLCAKVTTTHRLTDTRRTQARVRQTGSQLASPLHSQVSSSRLGRSLPLYDRLCEGRLCHKILPFWLRECFNAHSSRWPLRTCGCANCTTSVRGAAACTCLTQVCARRVLNRRRTWRRPTRTCGTVHVIYVRLPPAPFYLRCARIPKTCGIFILV